MRDLRLVVLLPLACAAVCLAPAAHASEPAIELAPGVRLVRGGFEPGRQPDGNSVVFRAPEGPIVVDTGRHQAHTEQVLEVCASLGGPPRAVVNTHWHLDHVGGNRLVRARASGVRVYSSAAIEGALESDGFLSTYARQLEGMIANASTSQEDRTRFETELGLIRSGDALAPDEVLSASGTRSIAGRAFEIHVEPYAVTAADVWLLDRESGVLVAGDLVTLPAPFLDTACPSGWEAALERVAATEFRVLVPGHGAPMTRRELGTYRVAFRSLLACAASDRAAAECVDGWFGDGGMLTAPHDSPFARSLVTYYVENSLRADPAAIAKLCGKS